MSAWNLRPRDFVFTMNGGRESERSVVDLYRFTRLLNEALDCREFHVMPQWAVHPDLVHIALDFGSGASTQGSVGKFLAYALTAGDPDHPEHS